MTQFSVGLTLKKNNNKKKKSFAVASLEKIMKAVLPFDGIVDRK